MAGRTTLSAPLLPDHPPLLHRDKHGEHTVWVSPDLPASMARSNGQWSLSDFQLTKQLYKGKASTLYTAVDRPSGVVVALKSYSKRRLSPLNWYQVEREVRLHAQLRHPNIIALYAAFEDDNYVFMVTEYAEGGDLYEDLKRAGGQLKERMVAREVLMPFMTALNYMHSNSIIHRDIKPENILLAADRTIKVADFGLSINWGEERPVTRAGTLDYMSPEVLACPEKNKPEENKEKVELGYTDAVDVWAVGILAYELLVGRPPFERESREETYQYIQRRDPMLPPWMTDLARDFITSALAKSARKRPSMLQLLLHPWIQMHARRPSIPPTSPAASDLHLPLHELSGPGGMPFSELHRHSLHGAKSCRDFNSLLSPAPSASAHSLTSLLQPALSMAAPALSAAAAAALNATGVRPTTASSSRLGGSTAPRPVTPLAGLAALQTLASGLPSSAFPMAEPAGSQGGTIQHSSPEADQHATADQQGPAGGVLEEPAPSKPATSHGREPHHSHFSAHSAATKLLNPSFNVHQAALPPPAVAGDQQSAFLELYESMVPPAPERMAPSAASGTPRGTGSRKATSSSRAGGRGSTHSKEVALPPLQQQQQRKEGEASASQPTAPGRLPSLRKALSQPMMVHLDEMRAAPQAGASAAAAVCAAGASTAAAGSTAPGAHPTTATEQAALQAVAAVAAQAVREAPSVSQPAPLPEPEVAGLGLEAEHDALEVIPEQPSDEAEPAATFEQPSKPDGGHLVMPGMTKAPAVAADYGEGGIPAVHAPLQLPGSGAHQQQEWQEQQQQAGDGAEGSEDASSPMLSAHVLAHNRMREAEQRHVDKLRARAASAAVPGTSGAAMAAAAPAGSRSPKQWQVAPASIGSGLAKSATTLLSKLLRKKPAAGASSPAGAAAAAGPTTASPSRSSAVRKASTATVEQSAASSTSAAFSGSFSGLGTEATASKSKSPMKQRLSLPPVHLASRGACATAGQPVSPRSRPSQLHTSTGSLVQRRSVAAGKQGTPESVTLRSPVGATAARPRMRSGKVVPTPAAGELPSAEAPTATEPGHQAATMVSLASGADHSSASGAGEEAESAVASCSHSKSVRFASGMSPLGPAGPSCEVDPQDLIPAVHHTDSTSYTSAFSSLPASSLPSLNSGAASPLRASRKGSASPPICRKASHVTPSHSRTSLARALGGSGTSSGGAPGRLRGSKMASMPGEAARASAAAAGQTAEAEHEDGHARADEGEVVQRSAASWSHPASAAAGSSAIKARGSSAAAARLSMYLALQNKRGGGDARASLHKPAADAAVGNKVPSAAATSAPDTTT